ncbi:MAG TPA: GAF domain-containing protein, partial [Sediminibacterium sp.]|nr:GAF domain-containing protein [Sediminibacterium sp.]
NLQVFYDMLNNNLGQLGFYQVISTQDGTQKLLFISSTYMGQIGYSHAEVMANPEIITNIIAEEFRGNYLEARNHCFKTLSNLDMELKCVVADGSVKWFHLYGATKVLADGNVVFNAIQSDITKSKQNEEKLLKYNRELTLRNQISDRIAKQVNLQELFNSVCHCLVTDGGYLLAVVSLKPDEHDPDQHIYPLAKYGLIEYVDAIRIDLSDENLRKGPTGTALLEQRTVITNDFHHSDITSPWWEIARKYNVSSSIVIPLQLANDKMGALTVYSERMDAYDEHEVETLEMIAHSVSIAANNIQHKLEKEHSRNLLQERMKELRTMYNSSQILHSEHLHFDEKMTQIVRILPLDWQFIEDCVAKINVNHKEYVSKNYKKSLFSITCPIFSMGKQIGFVEIDYSSVHKTDLDGPFLSEEKKLLEALAKMIGEYCDKTAANKELLQSKANLSTIFKNTEVGYILLDNAFNIISFNDSVQNGYANQLGVVLNTGENFLRLIPEEKVNDLKKTLFRAIAQKRSVEYEVSYTKKHEVKYYSINVNPVVDGGLVLGISFSAYDITRRKQEEIEQQKITHDLLQRNRDLEQFSYIVSHNIRAPLSNILGLNAALKIAGTKEEERFLLEGIYQSAEILDNVIKDINYILQINRTVFEEKEQLDLNTVYDDVEAGIADLIKQKGAIICKDFSRVHKFFTVKAYLLNVFHNLIVNSLKFSRPDTPPEIHVWSEISNNKLVLHFRDNGMGVDLEKYGAYMFGLYKRFHPQIQGKGMGLYIVRSQVQFLGGDITVSSVVGVGSEFIIYLPFD